MTSARTSAAGSCATDSGSSPHTTASRTTPTPQWCATSQARALRGAGAVIPGERRGNRFAGKLTWRVGSSSNVDRSRCSATRTASSVRWPRSTVLPAPTSEPTTPAATPTSARDIEGTVGRSVLVRALYGQHRQSDDAQRPRDRDAAIRRPDGQPQGEQRRHRPLRRQFTRDATSYKIDVSKFVKDHELKIGADVEDLRGTDSAFVSGGDAVRKLSGARWHGVLRPLPLRRRSGCQVSIATTPSTWQPAQPFYSAPRTRNLSAYVQDAWQIRKGLALNLGLRFEHQRLEDRDGTRPARRRQLGAPRGRRLGRAPGRPQQALRELQPLFREHPAIDSVHGVRRFDHRGVVQLQSRPQARLPPIRRRTGCPPSSAATRPPWILTSRVSTSTNGWWVWSASCAATSCSGSKGAGGGRDASSRISMPGTVIICSGTPAKDPLRPSRSSMARALRRPAPSGRTSSFEVTARKRLSSGWQLLGSYVVSRLRGNYDGSYQRSTGQANPNWNSGFDWADLLVNASGPLTSESEQQGKLDGSYEFARSRRGPQPGGFVARIFGPAGERLRALFQLLQLGVPISRRAAPSDEIPPMSASISTPAIRSVSEDSMRLRVEADVFDPFNRQALLSYDQRYNLFANGPCAGIPDGLCNGDGGLAARPGTLIPERLDWRSAPDRAQPRLPDERHALHQPA